MDVTVDGKTTLDNLICMILIFVVKCNWSEDGDICELLPHFSLVPHMLSPRDQAIDS